MHPRSPALAAAVLALVPVAPTLAQEPPGPVVAVAALRDIDLLPVRSTTRVVVRFLPGVETGALDRHLAPLDARVAEVGYGDAFQVLEVPRGTVDAWVTFLSGQPQVAFAEPDGIVHAFGNPPNDPFFGYQWHLMDRGMVSGTAVSNHGIQAPAAWTKSTGSGAVVAIVDTGVAYENFGGYALAPDLANTAFVAGYDFVNGDTHANDDQGHGTHVAGTIAQSTDNGLGVAGVAHDATIMPIKVLDSSGSGSTTWVANGIRYAADHGAHVINLSLGSSLGSAALQDAVDYAWSRGVVICAATGNSGTNTISYPAAYANCIAVGATRFDGARAGYSQRGTGIDVSAPGGDTNVDQNGDGFGDGVLQQTFSGSPTSFSYYFFQGTSMATPHVAGIAALVRAAKPTATNSEIRAAIESTCVDLGTAGYDTTYGHGLVDANAAVDAVLGGGGGDVTPPAAPVGLTAIAGNGSVGLGWADNGEPDLAGYIVYRATSAAGPFAALNGTPLVGSAYVDGAVANGTTYHYRVTAVDTSGNESAASSQASATPSGADTTPPAAPTGLTGSASGRSAVLDWSDNSEPDLAGYNVYRTTSRSGIGSRINAVPVTGSAYTDGPLASGRYYYRVTAVDTAGNESGVSARIQVRIR
jgi:serine protease